MPQKSKFLKGKLLLDGGKLRGSFFHRSVVLICQHDAEGAMGLILNRPGDNKVGEMLVADLSDKIKNERLFIGGPVQPAALSFLHSDEFVPHANVMANLNLGHSLESLVEIGESYSKTQRVRVFGGYAGWTAGQLEDEMKRGAWVVHPATIELVFDDDPDNLWQRILAERGWEGRLIAQAPEDLSWN